MRRLSEIQDSWGRGGEHERRLVGKNNITSRNRSRGHKLALIVEAKLLADLCDLLVDGCSIKTACEAFRLSESPFFRPAQRGLSRITGL
jgi:hypothetical protein